MENQTFNPMRVLLVEDAPLLRATYGRVLRIYGYDVMEAHDGEEALACVSAFRPDLVLTDLMMPGMGGVELIERLRSTPETARLPIMALTANASAQLEHRARAAGAVDFLTKPVDLPVLLDRLRSLQN